MPVMRILFYIGLGLMVAACFTAAAEMAAHAMPGDKGAIIVSARDLWYTFWPKSLLVFEIRVNRLVPWLLDPYLLGLMKLPAWLIFGAPGLTLMIKARPPGGVNYDNELREAQESFELFDELTRLARAEQVENGTSHEVHGPQDLLPDHLMGEDLAPDANLPTDFEAGEIPSFEDGGEQK